MAEKIIITGVNGFVADHVIDTFQQDGYEIIGVAYDKNPNPKVVTKLGEYVSCNLLDLSDVSKINFENVNAVIHLAGLSAVGLSFEQPQRFISENAAMTYNLLDHAKISNFDGRIIVVSTGALYDPTQKLPLSENSQTLASSPYAIGKLATEHVVNYFRSRGVDVITVRPFNHIGPGQGKGFILPDLYAQVMESGDSQVIKVGNITTQRDYTDVRDIALAYKMLALAPNLESELYNICSGESLSGEFILQSLEKAMGVEVSTEVDTSKLRPNDIAVITGDSSRLRNELGWHPNVPIDQTIIDFIDTERQNSI